MRAILLVLVLLPVAGFAQQPMLLGPVQENKYGPGVHADVFGAPFRYEDRRGNAVLGPVVKDGYGLGVHRDQYGGAVRVRPGVR